MTWTILPAALLLLLGSLMVAYNPVGSTAVVACLIVAAALAYAIGLNRATGEVVRSARRFAAEIRKLGADGLARHGADSYPALHDAWLGYRASLVVDPRSGALAGRVPAEEFFHVQAVGRVVDLGLYPAVPGVLVGLGLYFTFLGLALALAATGSGLGAADPAQARAALEKLFAVAAFKFTTSLVAMACSLLFTLMERRRAFEVQRALAELATALDRTFPPLSLEAMLGAALVPAVPVTPARSAELQAAELGRAAGEAAAAAVTAQLAPLAASFRAADGGQGAMVAAAIEQELARSLALARQQAEAELAAFRGEAGRAFQGLLAEHLGAHERLLTRVEGAMADLHKFAGGVGLYTGDRIHELQRLATTTAGQADRVDASYQGLVERVAGAMQANNQHMQRFLQQAEERQVQFFEAYDEAVSRLTGEILKAANYLAEAADRRYEGA